MNNVVNNVDKLCQFQWHHETMNRTKTSTQNNTKTRRTPRRNRHLEKSFFVFFGLGILQAADLRIY